mmetsp:Transcript_1183/g.3816  ORF Transcript_1183/g.3816 Transcript_1183/m.3816 type:complete len:392 (+) Transcript_1183:2245-3420(+)
MTHVTNRKWDDTLRGGDLLFGGGHLCQLGDIGHDGVGALAPRQRGALHGVDVILLCVASGQVEVSDRGLLVRPERVHAGRLPVQALSNLDHGAPCHVQVLCRREEGPDLLVNLGTDFVVGFRHVRIGRGQDALHQGALALLVVVHRGGEGEVGKAREVRVSAVQQVVQSVCLTGTNLSLEHLVLHLSHPPVVPELDGNHGDANQLENVVEEFILPPSLRDESLRARDVQGGDVDVRLDDLLLSSLGEPQARDLGRVSGGVLVVHDLPAAPPGVNASSPRRNVVRDGSKQPVRRGAAQHAEGRGVRLCGKELENRKHAPGRDVLAVQESKSICNRIPHPVNAGLAPAVTLEPVCKGDVVQGPDVPHASLRVDQRPNDRRRPQSKRVGQLIGR